MVKQSPAPVFLAQPWVDREWIWVIALICLLVLAEFVGLGRYIRSGGERVLNPALTTTSRILVGLAGPLQYAQSLTTAQRRIQDLEQRYAEATAELGQMSALQVENEALRAMLRTSDIKLEERLLTTPIVSYGKPLIAGGSRDGIQTGAMVLIAQTLVGRVTTVSEHQAEVGLLSRTSTTPVLARTESGLEGVVRGDDKRVLLTEVPINEELTVGERVVTQGQAGIAPNILIGRVASVTSRPESAVQTAVIEQLVSFYEATVVEIR